MRGSPASSGPRGALILAALALTALLALGSTALRAQGVERGLRVFDVSFLVPPLGPRAGEPPRLPVLSGPAGAVLRRAEREPVIPFTEEAPGGLPGGGAGPWLPGDALAETVESFVAADSWANTRNRLDLEDAQLVVVQEPAVLDAVERFVGRLAARAARVHGVEIALVPPAALEVAAPGALAPGAAPWLEAGVIERAVAAAGNDAVMLAAPVRDGIRRRLRPGRVAHRLVDHEVNQTGVVPVVNSEVRGVAEGAAAGVTLYPAPGGRWLRCDVELSRSRVPGTRTERLPAGDVESPALLRTGLAGSFVAPPGRTVLLGVLGPLADGQERRDPPPPAAFAALLRVRGAAAPETGGPGEEGEADARPALVDIGLLTALLPGVEMPPRLERHAASITLKGEEDDASRVPGELLDRIALEALPGALRDPERLLRTSGILFVDAPPDAARAVRDALESEARRRSAVTVMELVLAPLSAGADVPRSGELLDSGAAARLLATEGALRVHAAGLAGHEFGLGSVAGRTAVVDLEHVSGGSEDVVIEAADPVVEFRAGGAVLAVRADPIPGSEHVRVRVEGESAGRPRFDRSVEASTASTVEPAGAGEEVEAAGEPVTITLPDATSLPLTGRSPLPAGRLAVLDVRPHPSRPGTTLVLAAAARTVGIAEALED